MKLYVKFTDIIVDLKNIQLYYYGKLSCVINIETYFLILKDNCNFKEIIRYLDKNQYETYYIFTFS